MVLRGCPGPERMQCPPPRAQPLRSWALRLGDPGLAAWPLWALASCPLTAGPHLLPLSRLPAPVLGKNRPADGPGGAQLCAATVFPAPS